jgi:hypothetical protein
MVAAKLANMVVGGKETNSANLQNCPPVSQASAATMLNVSERTVADAAKVRDKAAPELKAAVEQGHIAVQRCRQGRRDRGRQGRTVRKTMLGTVSDRSVFIGFIGFFDHF